MRLDARKVYRRLHFEHARGHKPSSWTLTHHTCAIGAHVEGPATPGQQHAHPAVEAEATSVRISTTKTPASPATPDQAPPPPAVPSPTGNIGAAAAGAAASGDSSAGAAGGRQSRLKGPAAVNAGAGHTNTLRPKYGAHRALCARTLDRRVTSVPQRDCAADDIGVHVGIYMQHDWKVQRCRL